jgi:putative protease
MSEMKKMELLSPGGSIEKIETAFTYGADSVYFGLKDFSLRTNAKNVEYGTADKLREIKKRFGGKMYCTVNIYFHEDDISKLEEKLDSITDYPFDAFILSDIGILDVLRSRFPSAEYSLSTQASCINSRSARIYHDMGFNKVILGRETPLRDIRKIKDANPDLLIETFVHGAMCMAYSGRCFLSSHLAGRSGNYGDCAHTCRWNYRLALEEESRPGRYYPILEENDWTTIMSSKDLCMIDHLADLRDAGVDTLKIEGRMKSIYYVASVTRAYRKALDHLYDPSVEYLPYREELFNVSHREFSTGFFFGNGPVDVDEADPLVAVDDINVPTTGGYLRDYMFLGTVLDQVAPGVYSIDIKNQIRNGETIEFIGPDVLFIREDHVSVLDADFKAIDHLDHCRTGYIKTSAPLQRGYIIRKEIKLS